MIERWEYRCTYPTLAIGDRRRISVWPSPTEMDYGLNLHGVDGWELIQIIVRDAGLYPLAIWKRPLVAKKKRGRK